MIITRRNQSMQTCIYGRQRHIDIDIYLPQVQTYMSGAENLQRNFIFIMCSCSENTTGEFGRFSLGMLSHQLVRVSYRTVVQKELRERNAIPFFSQQCDTCQHHKTPLQLAASVCLQQNPCFLASCFCSQPVHSERSAAAVSWVDLTSVVEKAHVFASAELVFVSVFKG